MYCLKIQQTKVYLFFTELPIFSWVFIRQTNLPIQFASPQIYNLWHISLFQSLFSTICLTSDNQSVAYFPVSVTAYQQSPNTISPTSDIQPVAYFPLRSLLIKSANTISLTWTTCGILPCFRGSARFYVWENPDKTQLTSYEDISGALQLGKHIRFSTHYDSCPPDPAGSIGGSAILGWWLVKKKLLLYWVPLAQNRQMSLANMYYHGKVPTTFCLCPMLYWVKMFSYNFVINKPVI